MYLSMYNNSFDGKLQIPAQNWKKLLVLHLGHISFSGRISRGIRSILNTIQILNLRNNKLFGKLLLSLCRLSNLQIVDLS